METIPDIALAASPFRSVHGQHQGATACFFYPRDQLLCECAVFVDVQLEPEWSGSSRRYFFDSGIGKTADYHKRAGTPSRAYGCEFAIGMGETMKRRGSDENRH